MRVPSDTRLCSKRSISLAFWKGYRCSVGSVTWVIFNSLLADDYNTIHSVVKCPVPKIGSSRNLGIFGSNLEAKVSSLLKYFAAVVPAAGLGARPRRFSIFMLACAG